jgi:NAD(P)-dependent dehydrogenase (short-subunit alcohol dehydrogenase family)
MVSYSLSGRTALVTGAGSGLGEAIARRLAAAGAVVAVIDRDATLAEAVRDAITRAGGSARAFAVDATSASAVETVVRDVAATSGPVDILVNNVGGYRTLRRIWEIDEAEWDAVLSLNLKTAFLWSKAVVPAMIDRRCGRVISLTSGAGKPGAGNTVSAAHYAASKAGIRGLTWHLAQELAPHGVTANAIAPGPADTERFRKIRAPEATVALISKVPMGRLAQPNDVAGAVLFLASEDASYITGVTLDVSGGWVMS